MRIADETRTVIYTDNAEFATDVSKLAKEGWYVKSSVQLPDDAGTQVSYMKLHKEPKGPPP